MKTEFRKIAKKYNLKLIILFGSFVANKTHKESDIDVAILRDKELTLKQDLNLRTDLYKIFKREIDLVSLKNASPLLLSEIALKGNCVYGSKSDFLMMRIFAIKQYLDFEPYFRLREKILNKHFS